MPSDNPIAANPDESAGYRRGAGNSKGPRPGGGGRMLGLNLVLAILVAGLVVAGWFVANQHQQLIVAEAKLVDADTRLARLEARLSMTDQTMSDAGDEVQDKLGFWESEIRKVWDVANKRNRNWIVENQGKLTQQQERIARIDTALNSLKSSVSRHDEAFGQQAAMLDQLAAIELQIRQLGNQQRQATDQVNATRQSVAALESGLARRVAENEEAVDAIDAYRLQLNSRMNGLIDRVEALHGVTPP